jgi:hypothetical protein
MDPIGEEIESEVNDALPGYLKFHGVNKIVVKLGPNGENAKDYSEVLGVGVKQWNAFDLGGYVMADEPAKRRLLRDCVTEVFSWIESNFADAEFVKKARNKVPWLPR